MFRITSSRVLTAVFIVGATESTVEHTGDGNAHFSVHIYFLVVAETKYRIAFWFHPGYGACEFVNSDNTDLVADGSGESNSICDHRFVATANGKTVYAHIVDDFDDSEYDLGFSPAAFEILGGQGNISGFK
ncbi:hypothetical protein C8J57DRAFT_1508021 [Mycena rebaudengoi]|nr:hypothetical protein C8J57DRAFT_1508021 [Mycena rebaudengoi]